MQAKPNSYNYYFLIPFVLWLIIGALLLLFIGKESIFIFINTHYSSLGDILMYYATWLGQGWVITLILFFLLAFKRFRNKWYFFTALFCAGFPPIVSQFIKRSYDLPRPYKYFNKASWIHISQSWGDILTTNSFPSGHTTGAFALFCLLSMLLTPKYRIWGLLFFLIALTVGYSRIYLAAHFFTDVYAGSIIGTVFSLLIFVLTKKISTSTIKY